MLLPRGDRRAVCVHEGAVLVVPLQAFSFPIKQSLVPTVAPIEAELRLFRL